jgi:hypothetical protein
MARTVVRRVNSLDHDYQATTGATASEIIYDPARDLGGEAEIG